MLKHIKRYDDAHKMYQRAIYIRPYFEAAVFDLASLYDNQKKMYKAIEAYRNYIEINPARINLKAKIGYLLMKDKKYEEAKKIQ